MNNAHPRMVDRHLRARGVLDPRVLDALGAVPRQAFAPPELAEHAYEDNPLPIEAGQAILPAQFDEYIWFDETEAVHPLSVGEAVRVEQPHPLAP